MTSLSEEWFCSSCGQTIPSEWYEFCPTCGTKRQKTWQCSNCNKITPDAYKFCLECGRERPRAKPEASPKPKREEVFVGRGGDFQGGHYLYKVKVQNLTEFTISNVVVSVISYPDECLKLLEPPSEEKGSAEMRRYKRIPPNDFVTATFEFSPYKDCIKGEIQASVHYYDVRNKMHTVDVEPHPVKIVCDLLSPLRVGARDFDQLIASWSRTGEEQKLDGWNPRDFFNTATSSLTSKNFSVVSADSTVLGGQFTGIIKCLAKGIFTNKRVGLVVYIRGPPEGRTSLVKVEANSEDESQVLPVFNEVMDTFRQMPPITLVAPGGVAAVRAEDLVTGPERQERIGLMDEAVKKRVVGYLKAEESRRVKIASVAARFSLPPQQVEDIVYEAIAEGRVEGYIDDKTQEFVVAGKEREAGKPEAVIHVGGDYIAGTSVRDSVVMKSSVADKAVKKCKSCNRDIPLESNFCPECGSRT